MIRKEAIATITAQLESFDDERVQVVANLVQSLAVGDLRRALSGRELALLAQAERDFATGNTLTLDEMDAYLDAARARRSSARSA